MLRTILYLLLALGDAQSEANSHYLRGVDLLRNRDPSRALDEFDEALKLRPQLAEAHHARGLALLAQGDPAAASDEFRRAIKLKPSLAEAHLGLGLALGQSGALEPAAAEFRAALRIRPVYAEAHKRLGITLRRLGDEKGALAELEAAAQADGKDPEAWYNLGLAQKSAGNTTGAIGDFRRAIELKPDFEQAHYNLGIALRMAGSQAAASKELGEIRGLHDFRAKLTESKALILRGVEALGQDRNDEALRLFEQASNQSPALPTAWHFLGVAYDRKGDSSAAVDAWRKALSLQPDYAQTHTAMGLMRARSGDLRQAETEFRQAASLNPDDAETHYNLGLALAKLQRPDEAVQEFTEAVSLEPRYPDARMQLALAHSAQGDLSSAASAYRELIRERPEMAEAHNNLGLVFLQQNNVAAARREFQRALELKPGFAPALQNTQLTEPCQVAQPTATLVAPHAAPSADGMPELNADPQSGLWKRASSTPMLKDCSHNIDYPALASEVRVFWTDSDLYLLFICPYQKLNIWEPAQKDRPRNKLWDRDVVEFFLGSDWTEIRKYREFEIAPTGDWIDLAIDLSRKSYDRTWRSGWKITTRIDEKAHVWYAAARVPLKSVSETAVEAGTKWRVNLYRIEGEGPDSKRHFLCWQPTCAGNRDPNHVPENFGTLVFSE
ncbi:MAG: tetratricopeptide repeat protein [Bryobacteraceae bacterium]